MDHWDNFFATTGSELDIQDAILALERVLDLPELDIPARITLEAATAVLRELESAPPPSANPARPGSVGRSN